MEKPVFRVYQKTGTYADVLEAVGLGYFLNMLMPKNVERITDRGSYYEIILRRAKPIEEWNFNRIVKAPGYPYFSTKKDKQVPIGYDQYDYEEEKEREKRYWEKIEKNKKLKKEKAVTEDVYQAMEEDKPHPRHSLMKNLYVLQAFNSHNKLLQEISQAEPEEIREALLEKLQSYTETALQQEHLILSAQTSKSNKKEHKKRKKAFSPSVSAVQALNPIIGKGVNRTKPTGTGLAGLPSSYVDWFAEYLRYIAVHRIANAYNIRDDIKIAVIVPADVTFTYLEQLSDKFVKVQHFKKSSCQIDIQNIIAMARELLYQSQQKQEQEEIDSIRKKTPKKVISAVANGYFKSLGTGKALINVSSIGLPGWFPIETAEDVDLWLGILDEHKSIIDWLKEEHSEEAKLLFQYRDFISSGNLKDLLNFSVNYGLFAFRETANSSKEKRIRMSEELLERLVIALNKGYSVIVSNPGFKAVADAIRRATVSEQFRKAQGKQEYEIHYGLLSDLKRKARSKKDVVALLGDFISSYNYENARKAEVTSKQVQRPDQEETFYRQNVTDEQVIQLVELIDDFGPEPVTMLLAAVGSAKKAKKEG
ncbi:hypothetical protein F9B85_08590 [Heliorestis acidaminivorans]|uniref:Type I-B CRISPR-associated protein Cas8b1/Cst1 n=1 Tax=Heliorestis acidaminivorans TaxID=553427 RepID=A0A6I0F5Y8_9FIRM|nr:hypothetical protein [Heliorestis acidaminivorans]KAB2952699.1 hypothetical protein F9B85_08590 [Heliorestis acidaminivorans]